MNILPLSMAEPSDFLSEKEWIRLAIVTVLEKGGREGGTPHRVLAGTTQTTDVHWS